MSCMVPRGINIQIEKSVSYLFVEKVFESFPTLCIFPQKLRETSGFMTTKLTFSKLWY